MMITPTRFIACLLGTVLSLSVICAAATLLMDPRGLFGLVSIEGINSKKFSFFQREHFIKPYQVIQFQPDTLLLGNSIANSAFDLHHPALANAHVYSYGIAGAGMYTNWLTLLHIQDQLPHTVVLFLDYSAFFAENKSQSKQVIDQSDLPRRLRYHSDGSINHRRPLQVINDYFTALLSWDAIADCLETWRRQNEDGWHLQSDGSWGGGSSQTGKPQRKRFLYVEKEIFLKPLAAQRRDLPFFQAADGENTLAYYEAILNLLQQHNVNTILVIPPAHARLYEALFVQHQWAAYQIWKRQLVAINERLAASTGHTPFRLWDFSGYNPYTTESVPPLNDKQTRMQWFYDSVHFKPALGSNILETLFNPHASPSIGLLLTSATVESQLTRMEQGHLDYASTHPEDVNDIVAACRSVSQNVSACDADTVAP